MRLGEHTWIDRVEDGIYILTGAILAMTAIILLIWSVINFITTALSGAVGSAVLQALDSLLLVVMLVEIMHTVRISLRTKVLVIEPFLIVGIIAAVRRVLVVTAEQAHPTAEEAVEFRLAMIELGILTVMILTLVGAIFIIRHFPRPGSDSGSGDSQEIPMEERQKASENRSGSSLEQRNSSISR